MRHRKVLAAALALGLALGASALGAGAAFADPAAPAIDPSLAGDYTSAPELFGIADPGSIVTVSYGDDDIYCTSDVVDEAGNWSCSPPEVGYGEYELTATAAFPESASGPPSAPVTIHIYDNTEVSIDSPTDGTVLYTTTPTVSGQGAPGADISLLVGGESVADCDPADETGAWACTTDPLAVGGQTITVVATPLFVTEGDTAAESTADVDITVAGQPSVAFAPGEVTVSVPDYYDSIDFSREGDGWNQLHSWNDESGDGDPCTDSDTGITCSGLQGRYRVDAYSTDDGASHADQYFYVPSAPQIVGELTITSDHRVLFGVDAEGSYYDEIANGLILYINGVATGCLNADGSPASSDTEGGWTCETAPLGFGSHTIAAASQDLGNGEFDSGLRYLPGAISATSAAVTFTLTAPVVPPGPGDSPAPTPGPTPSPTAPTWTFDLGGLDLGNVHPGDKFTIHGSGLPAGATVTFELHSTPVTLGSATVGPDGNLTLSGVIPAGTIVGIHHIVATMSGSGIATSTVDKQITVKADAASDATASTTSGTAAEGDVSSGTHEGGVVGDPSGAGDPIAPNVLTNGLFSIGDVLVHPGKVPSALAVGLVLLVFAVLPAHLLNATIAEQYDHLVRRVPRLGRTPRWLAALRAWLGRAPVLGGLAVTTVTALVFGFADPKFGLTLASLRLFLAVAIALFIVVYLANAIAGRVVSKSWNIDVKLSVRPLGLVLTVIGVVVSRALDFSPGFLIGLVLGLSIAGKSAASHAWKAVLIRSGVVITVALAAWIGYSAFPAGEHEGSTFFSELALETLVAITTEGVVALLVELLPIHLLEGERLYKHSRPLWAAVYLALLVIFIVAVVPWEGNWAELGSSLWSWLAVVVTFGAICVGIYLFFRIRSRNEHEDEHAGDELVSVSDNE